MIDSVIILYKKKMIVETVMLKLKPIVIEKNEINYRDELKPIDCVRFEQIKHQKKNSIDNISLQSLLQV